MKRRLSLRSFIIVTIIIAVSIFYQFPYYVTNPGMAKKLDEVITVEDGYDESGSFMLTTIRMGRANIYLLGLSAFSKHSNIVPITSVQAEDETEEEYTLRQLYYMDNSKISAIEVAYKKADKYYKINSDGVYVLGLIDNMPAAKKLQLADRIYAVDGLEFERQNEFVNYVNEKSAGEVIKVSLERDGKKLVEEIEVAAYKDEPNKSGIGILLVEDRNIETKPKVEIETSTIGGPSAGFMFSLEIYNRLTEKDYTHGYNIAGTGTIDSEGNIGRIGGIDQKIVAAHKSGADIFFAPFEQGAEGSNYDVAVKTAKQIKTKMEIVPVDTFDEAIYYLDNLK